MSSKSSPFASFADAAEPSVETTIRSKDEPLTVAELLDILHKLISLDPSAKDKLVFYAGSGSLTPATIVTTDMIRVIISSHY